MLKNNEYNIMMQIVEEHKSLWRIKNEYMKDSESDEETKAFWEHLAKEKESHIEKLTKMIKERL
ncbi:hypothetical protein H6790_02480 [Candidatus Nomurabacteria bacterium]|nr:hypothetical protein [Candidatus Nomurabacteria bacterium]MCB9820790.1 hypothetical protein [Candidatus Nomurabacteria bacterium]